VISPGKAITNNITSSSMRKKGKAPRIKYKKDQEHQYSREKKPPSFFDPVNLAKVGLCVKKKYITTYAICKTILVLVNPRNR
jgi:hypothetical protein